MDIIQRHEVTDRLMTLTKEIYDLPQARQALDEVVLYLMSLEKALDILDGWKAVVR